MPFGLWARPGSRKPVLDRDTNRSMWAGAIFRRKDMPGHAQRYSAVSCWKWRNLSAQGRMCYMGVHIDATWRIRLNRPQRCGLFVKITLTPRFRCYTLLCWQPVALKLTLCWAAYIDAQRKQWLGTTLVWTVETFVLFYLLTCVVYMGIELSHRSAGLQIVADLSPRSRNPAHLGRVCVCGCISRLRPHCPLYRAAEQCWAALC